MRINGQEISGLNVETIVIPRGNGNDIILQCRAVPDYKEFEALVPEPTPPVMLVKNQKVPDLKDKSYRQMVAAYGETKVAYIILKSLEETDIEWDTVDMDNPKTWTNYVEDFKAAGLTAIEVDLIAMTVMRANALDEKKLEQARALFQLGQRLAAESTSGPSTEPATT